MNPEFSDLDVAWAAGFLDGEGCFTLTRQSNAADPTCRALHISASQTNPAPLLKLQVLFGGTVREHSRKTAKGTTIYIWLLGQKADVVREFVPKVLPYLVVKREQARILFEFAVTVKYRGHKRNSINEEDVALRMRLIDEMDRTRAS